MAPGAANEEPTARAFLPERKSLTSLREAAAGCRGCGLWERATQTVFGEGLRRSRLMLVGEQPGDREDREGRPFVGPAGRMLNSVLDEAEIPRDDAFVTNVVKHFKWEPRGSRRLHKKPTSREIGACLPWLEAEIAVVKPEVLVCLGATAARSLVGKDFRLTQHRGEWIDSRWAPNVIATVHPSMILRIPEDEPRREAFRQYVDDFRIIARALNGDGAGSPPPEDGGSPATS